MPIGVPAKDGDTYICSTWGYVFERVNGKWVRQHRHRMEQKLGRKLLKGEVVHHKDENKTNNEPDNLELMSEFGHKSHHGSKRKWSDETKLKMSLTAKLNSLKPEIKEAKSQRAKQQWEDNNFGRKIYK